MNDSMPSLEADSHKRLAVAVLAVILVLGSALRLYGLSSGLWQDEILTYVLYAKMPYREIVSTYDTGNQHFLYSLLAHASFQVFGESVWALRLPAVLFGIASIWALYLFGQQVTSTRETLLSVALLAFSYHHIWFSQNARGYTGLLFWTLLASWLFLRARREGRSQLWLLYAVVAALGVFTHMTMAFVVCGHFIIYLPTLWSRRKENSAGRWTGFFLGFCLAGILSLLLHAFILPQVFGTGMQETGSQISEWKNPLWGLLETLRGLQVGLGNGIVVGLALLVFGVGLISYLRTERVVVLLLLIPAFICAAATYGLGLHMWPRFFFFAAGFGILAVIRGMTRLGEMAARALGLSSAKKALAGTVLCIGLIGASVLTIPSVYGPKQDYQSARIFVQESREPGDAVVVVDLATFAYSTLYKTDWETVETLDALNAIRSQSKRTWLVYTLPTHLQSVYPDIMSSIGSDFTVVKEFYGTLGGGTVYVCRSDTPPALTWATHSDLGAVEQWTPG